MTMQLDLSIIWDSLTPEDYEAHLQSIPNSNLLQSPTYGMACRALYHQKSRLGFITINGQKAGIVQILESSILWKAVHAVILDRGPLWFEGYGGAAHIKAFFDVFHRTFKPRFGRKRRIIPEIEDGPTIRKILDQCGLERLDRPGYQTSQIDLTLDENTLKSNMRKNWRGALNKAERADIAIEWDWEGRYLDWMIAHYTKDKAIKGYQGPDPKTLHKIAAFFANDKACLIGRAVLDGEGAGGVMMICHGKSATYQTGWTTKMGRENNVNHLLLWQGMSMLESRGIRDFDLGGMNDESAKGVKLFKEGLGGKALKLVGHYR